MTGYYPCRIAPFGHLRIDVCLPLPAAFRSLPRPSSAPNAKAFALRPFTLYHSFLVHFRVLSTICSIFYPTFRISSSCRFFVLTRSFLICILLSVILFSSCFLLFCSLKNRYQKIIPYLLISILNQKLFSFSFETSGGHKWTRTIDLTLIRRAL